MSGKTKVAAKAAGPKKVPPPAEPEPEPPAPERVQPIREAEKLITGDRNNAYGEPDADFQRIAAMWSVIFDRTFTAHEVALAMICLKLSRLTWSPGRYDSWTDIVGYAGCGWETAVLAEKRKGSNRERS